MPAADAQGCTARTGQRHCRRSGATRLRIPAPRTAWKPARLEPRRLRGSCDCGLKKLRNRPRDCTEVGCNFITCNRLRECRPLSDVRGICEEPFSECSGCFLWDSGLAPFKSLSYRSAQRLATEWQRLRKHPDVVEVLHPAVAHVKV